MTKAQPIERFYIHGDKQDGTGDKYFCVICDLFEPYDHFIVEHSPSENDRRYEAQMKMVRGAPHLKARRPAKSRNIFG